MKSTDTKDTEENRYNIRSIDRAMKVLMAFDLEHFDMTIGEISKRTDLPKSTVHRIITSMIEWGMIVQSPIDLRYRLGLRLFELGSIVLAQMDLRREAVPLLQELTSEVAETTHLVVRDGNQAIYIEKVDSSESLVSYSQIGKHLPLYCTAAGKVLLADMPSGEVESLLGQTFPLYTKKTITVLSDLLAHLSLVRRSGYSVDNEELEIGLKCIAAPLFNHLGEVIAGISLSTLATRLDDNRVQTLTRNIKLVAREISLRLGFADNPKNKEWNQE